MYWYNRRTKIPLKIKNMKNNKHYNYQQLKNFLQNKHTLPLGKTHKFNDHIDNCCTCWQTWNKVRWDQAKTSQGMKELQEYLGDNFQEYFDSSWALAKDWKKQNPQTTQEISTFYKNTTHYLYNLLIWHESGDRQNYTNIIKKFKKKYSANSVIDFGSGIGTDTLTFANNGYSVYAVDFLCPSTDFMIWRVKKRKLENKIQFLNTEKLEQLPSADIFWAVDVLEHIPDPLEIVHKLSPKTSLFAHVSRFNDTHGGRHPCHLIFQEERLNKLLQKQGFSHIPQENISVWIR